MCMFQRHPALDDLSVSVQNGKVAYIATISTTDPGVHMYREYDYYLNLTRGTIQEWSTDKFAVLSWEDWLPFNPMPVAKKLRVPTLMIHSDGGITAGFL